MTKHLIATGHIGHGLESLAAELPKIEIRLCEYTQRCHKDCLDGLDCRIKKFYDRYPNYLEMGVGA